MMYGTFRFLVEFVREPDVQLGYLWGGGSRWASSSLPLVIVGVAVFVYALRRRLPQRGLGGAGQ